MKLGADRVAELDRQPVEGLDLDPVGRRAGFAERRPDDVDPLLDGEERLLSRVGEHADDDPVERSGRAADDVDVAVRDRVEGARVDRDAHPLLLAPVEGQGRLPEPPVAFGRQHTDPLGRSVAPEVLGDDTGVRCERRIRGPEDRQDPLEQLGLRVGRVDENDVERWLRRSARRASGRRPSGSPPRQARRGRSPAGSRR